MLFIDNGSNDGTSTQLQKEPGIRWIVNSENLGCARAWNQGIGASASAEWRIFLNNDVALPTGWMEGLISGADSRGLKIVSPAMREGALNYALEERFEQVTGSLGNFYRADMPHGVCFGVHDSVIQKIGMFDENFRVGQFEDADFFLRARIAGFKSATVGSSFIHHFGSVTQKSLRQDAPKRDVNGYEAVNRAYFRKKWRMNWIRRKWERFKRKSLTLFFESMERARSGTVLIDRSE